MLVLLDVNPVLAGFGQLAAIIILLFSVIFIVIAVAFNAALALGTGWLREKANLIKMLRPTVDSVNKTSEAAMQGHTSQDGNAIIRNIAKVPQGVQVADKKVEEATDKVAKAVIEFHARTVQVQTVAKAFLFPNKKETRLVPASVGEELQFNSPGYRQLMREKVSSVPVTEIPGQTEGTITASQLSQDVPSR